jgi:hypothetical protein
MIGLMSAMIDSTRPRGPSWQLGVKRRVTLQHRHHECGGVVSRFGRAEEVKLAGGTLSGDALGNLSCDCPITCDASSSRGCTSVDQQFSRRNCHI